jgi:hypothetical protein
MDMEDGNYIMDIKGVTRITSAPGNIDIRT